MVTSIPTTPSIVGMRDALLLVIPVREDSVGKKLLHSLTPCMYIY